MTAGDEHRGLRLAAILSVIAQADEKAHRHDRSRGDRDRHAEAAQHADRCAEAGRSLARILIEDAFPGVSWAMIERAAL
ncbi:MULTISPECIES: hypothetical protein [unclassified Sphingomonas]|uniref:hypothetical protein n=1 Tax=unclassified Sphingomonas TaxID=196159 RepID=UPI0006FF6F70|nr:MULTISPECIES: hypothetical protein [unclassified Sphingomonas]KQX17988.1 hypothetical protein ASD17_20055 [Sphingomonas sp. Root1294]KQY70913.1 hypothetical protein ASD39_23955 [Sphingomonas sp. Root50]KRB91591.1 hypothetical protein ASE22_06355 [Sphingomonas sp. Root720]